MPVKKSYPRLLASPLGLLLAGLSLLLPFVGASCAAGDDPRTEWETTWTGTDLVTGGRPDVALSQDVEREPLRVLDAAELHDLLGDTSPDLPAQPVAWLAVALIVAALAATALPSRGWRLTATGGLAIAAAIVLWGAAMLARNDAADAVATVLRNMGSSPRTGADPRDWENYGQVRDLFRFRYGLWIALVTLSAVGVANTVQALRDKGPAYGVDHGRTGTEN